MTGILHPILYPIVQAGCGKAEKKVSRRTFHEEYCVIGPLKAVQVIIIRHVLIFLEEYVDEVYDISAQP